MCGKLGTGEKEQDFGTVRRERGSKISFLRKGGQKQSKQYWGSRVTVIKDHHSHATTGSSEDSCSRVHDLGPPRERD